MGQAEGKGSFMMNPYGMKDYPGKSEPGKEKDRCYLSLLLKKGWGRRKREGDSRRDSTLKEGREECIKCQQLEEK